MVLFPFQHRQLLFCRVTLGKSFLQFSAMKMAHSPPGHHSVTGRPSVNGLALAEYVIYRGEQVKRCWVGFTDSFAFSKACHALGFFFLGLWVLGLDFVFEQTPAVVASERLHVS